MPDKQTAKPKRVLVLGAGAAGMSCAEQLSQSPDKFDVTVIEAQGYPGGQAFSIPIDEKKYGAQWMNQGVQGGSYIYHHTFRMMKKQGYEAKPVDLSVSFGKGDTFWTNSFPTDLLAKHQSEIRRFHWIVKLMKYTAPFWALIPLRISLKMCFFSDDFINLLIYPALALFLGTGNATPDLPTILMERLWNSPTYGMWFPPDPKALVSNLPPMVVFPEETKFYEDWQKDQEARGVKFRLNTEVVAIPYRGKKGVKVQVRQRREQEDKHNPNGADEDLLVVEEEYDQLVLCVLADTAKRLLGKTASFMEKRVLGVPTWSDDITVTHNDLDYMKKYYTIVMPDEGVPTTLGGRDESSRVDKARKEGWKPMYLIKQIPSDMKKLEMCFDCSAFQYQLAGDRPLEDHVFQTIYLNRLQNEEAKGELWTIDEIKEDKIIRKDWWHQLEHRWTHYAFCVPFMSAINNTKNTWYAAAWTLVNAHELACISGMAAAYAMGASYPEDLMDDGFAVLCFRLYLLLDHRKWFSKKENMKRLKKEQ